MGKSTRKTKNNKIFTNLAGGGAPGDSRSIESTLEGVTCDSELEETRASMVFNAGRVEVVEKRVFFY